MATIRSESYRADPACMVYDAALARIFYAWEDRNKGGVLKADQEAALRERLDIEMQEARNLLDESLASRGLVMVEGWGELGWMMDVLPAATEERMTPGDILVGGAGGQTEVIHADGSTDG